MLRKRVVPGLRWQRSRVVLPNRCDGLQLADFVQNWMQDANQDRRSKLRIVDRLFVHRDGHRRGKEKVFFVSYAV